MPLENHSKDRPRSKSCPKCHHRKHSIFAFKDVESRPRSSSCSKCNKQPAPLRKRSISASNLDSVEQKFVYNKSSNITDVLDCKSKNEYEMPKSREESVDDFDSNGELARRWSEESIESNTSTGSPRTRRRKTGFSSFSLSKFVTSRMSVRRRHYQPSDPRQLISAIRNNDFIRVRYLLESLPIGVNGCDSKGVTPIHEAALDGQLVIVELLLKHNAKLDIVDKDGFTCLDYAVYGGDFECAKFLIDNGATVKNVKDGVPACPKTTDWLC